MIVTFGCQKDIYVYDREKSSVLPRPPYVTHDNVDAARKWLKDRGKTKAKVITVK